MTSRASHDLTPAVTTASVADLLTDRTVDLVSSPVREESDGPPPTVENGGHLPKRPSGVVVGRVEPERVRCVGCRGFGWIPRNGALFKCRICRGHGRVVVGPDGTYRCGVDADLASAVEESDHTHPGGHGASSPSRLASGSILAGHLGGECLHQRSGAIPNQGDAGTGGHGYHATPERCVDVCPSCNGAGGYGEVMGGETVWLGDCHTCNGVGVL